MTATDIKGLGVSTTSADALAAYERGLDLFLRWRGGAVEALDAAAQRLDHVGQVIELAQGRLLANPHHVQSLAALAWAYERSGDTALRRHACRQLVLRAEEAGLASDAPELLAARRVLEATSP